MKVLGDDWFTVGDIYFRKLLLYDMPWGPGFAISRFKISVCQYSGNIAMYLDGQVGSKPILQIYTSAGKLVSQQIWKDAPALALGWSVSEELLVVQKTGFTTVLDLQGKYLRRFSMGPEAEEREIIDAKFFTIDNSTGVAVLTGGNHIFLTTSITTPRMRRLAELPDASHPLSSWQIITASLDPTNKGSPSESFRGPWALISRKRNLYRTDFRTTESIDLSKVARSFGSDIRLISVSSNMQFVAMYMDNGELLISNLRLSELHSHIDLTERISAVLPSHTDLNKTSTNLNHPTEILWLTTSAVAVKWDHLIALIGSHGDIYETFYADDMFLSQEIDGIRIITSTRHELLQRVPAALESLGRIGASCPATWLVSASKSLKLKSSRTNDYLIPIKSSNQMIEAISHCMEAACHSLLDSSLQQELLEAAHMGRTFLSAVFTAPDNCPPEGKVKELADQAARLCQTLRLLNSLAVPWIGIALTWRQFNCLGPNSLFEMLLARKHYPIAIELARINQKSQWPNSIVKEDQVGNKTCTFTRLLAHWACNSSIIEAGTAQVVAKRVDDIMKKLLTDNAQSITSKIKTVSPLPNIHTSNQLSIDFAEVANQALIGNRETVAEQILEYEPRVWRQIPLLLKLSRYNRALVRAVETGDPELITVVVAALQDQAKLPPADLAMALRRHPIALAIYQETWGQVYDGADSSSSNANILTQRALTNFRQENDRAAEAKRAVLSAYKETNLNSRLALLQTAEDIYKQLQQHFMAQECNSAINLLKFQSKLEKQEIRAPVFELKSFNQSETSLTDPQRLIVPTVCSTSIQEKLWVGQSLNTTLGRLLASGQCERQADQLRRDFRVSEKRYAFLRLIGMVIRNESWTEMDKMIKSKKPLVNLETIIKICIDGNHFEEAIKLIPRLPPERRVKFWILAGKIEEAIQTALREKSDNDLLYIQQHVGKNNRGLYERLINLRAQIR